MHSNPPGRDKKSSRREPHRELDALFLAWIEEQSDENAARFYDRALPRLRPIAAVLLDDHHDMDDVVQESLLRAMERHRTWDRSLPLLPWLTGLLRHRVLNLRRKRGRESSGGGDHGREAPSGDPVEALSAQEIERLVVEAVAALPARYREVVELRVLEGERLTSIAERLGRKPATVRMQLRRGLEFLKRGLPPGIGAALAPGWDVGCGARPELSNPATLGSRRVSGSPRFAALLATAAAVPLLVGLILGDGPEDGPWPEPVGSAPVGELVEVQSSTTVGRLELEDAGAAGSRAGRRIGDALRHSVVVRVTAGDTPLPGVDVELRAVTEPGLLVSSVQDAFGTRVFARFDDRRDRLVESFSTGSDGEGGCKLPEGQYLCVVPGLIRPLVVGPSAPAVLEIDVAGAAARSTLLVRDGYGRPSRAEVWAGGLDGAPLERIGETDDDGAFSGVLALGSWVQARTGGSCSSPRRWDGGTEITLGLMPAARLTGVVQLSRGGVAAGALVEVRERGIPALVRADEEGRFVIPGVAPGARQVSARWDGGWVEIGGAELALGREGAKRLDVRLSPAVRVSGVVRDACGAPLSGVALSSGFCSGSVGSSWTYSDDAGQYEMFVRSGLQARLVAGRGTDSHAERIVDAPAGSEVSWSPVLRAGAFVLDARVSGLPESGEQWVIAVECGDHFKPTFARVEGGRIRVPLPESARDRLLGLAVYREEDLCASGIKKTLPLASTTGVRASASEVCFRVPARHGEMGAVRARLISPNRGHDSPIRLREVDGRYWISVGRFDGASRAADVSVRGLMPGEYEFLLGPSLEPVRFTVEAGQTRDLGVVETHSRDAAARHRVEVVFHHPLDGTPMDRLTVTALGQDGSCLERVGMSGAYGSWRAVLSLPLGPAVLCANTESGLFCEELIEVTAASGSSFDFCLAAKPAVMGTDSPVAQSAAR